MCDTWVALRDATQTHQVIFAKNSDRPAFDCQPLVLHPGRQWSAGSTIQLEYVELPQVGQTYATLGSSPYWCWGYEEGINEHSVVIGNEAVFTKSFRQACEAVIAGAIPELGLLGMDLVRLALERSRTASQAVETIGSLVEQYGQYGSGVPAQNHLAGGYDNSYLIADPIEAWVLETAGNRWAAQRIPQGIRSISNQLTIRTHWDLGSPDIIDHALGNGWWPEDQKSEFDFARAYIDDLTPRQVSHIRLSRSHQLLSYQAGAITPGWMKRIARDHYEDTFLGGPYFDAANPDFHSLCMHVSSANFTWGNTASSCIAVLPGSTEEIPVFWWTPGPPCNGCYVPFFVHGSRLPAIVSTAGKVGASVTPPPEAALDDFTPDSYWWLFRKLLDDAKGSPSGSAPGRFPSANRAIRTIFDPLEEAFAAGLPEVLNHYADAIQAGEASACQILDDYTEQCIGQVLKALVALDVT
jgi:secernin